MFTTNTQDTKWLESLPAILEFDFKILSKNLDDESAASVFSSDDGDYTARPCPNPPSP